MPTAAIATTSPVASSQPAIPRLARGATGRQIADALTEHGCAIVERMAPAAAMDALMGDIAQDFATRNLGPDEFAGFRTKRVSGLMAKSATARELALEPAILEAADILLLAACQDYRLHVTHVVQIGPGEVGQRLHRDDSLYPMPQPKPVTELHGMWAVCDFTAENGATVIVPGSHRWDPERVAEPHETTQAVMPKGSVAFYLGNTIHGGGANRSAAPRTGALIGYNLGWLRQEENQYLTAPPEIARTFPDRLQELIGYRATHNGHLGWIDAGDPRVLLKDPSEREKFIVW